LRAEGGVDGLQKPALRVVRANGDFAIREGLLGELLVGLSDVGSPDRMSRITRLAVAEVADGVGNASLVKVVGNGEPCVIDLPNLSARTGRE